MNEHTDTETQKPGKIFAALNEAMKQINPISKDQTNKTQGFKFRGIDDVYNAVHPILASVGVFSSTTVLESTRERHTTNKGTLMSVVTAKVRFRFYAEDGSYVDSIIIGEAMDSGDKAYNKALAIAHKYAFLQLFCIPTKELAEMDPDGEGDELQAPDKTLSTQKKTPPRVPQQTTKNTQSNNQTKQQTTKTEKENVRYPNGVTEAQLRRMRVLQNKAGWTNEQLKAVGTAWGCSSSKEFNPDQYNTLCGWLDNQVPFEVASRHLGTEEPTVHDPPF